MTSNASTRTTFDRERIPDERQIERVSSIGPAARAVLHAARGVLADLDLERVLERLVESARELTGARYGALGVLDESGTSLARFITAGIDASASARIGPPPTGHGVLGELRLDRGPVRVAKIGAHPRSYGFPAAHPKMESFLGVTLAVAGEPFANLYLTDRRTGGPFTDADEDALVMLADFAGVAIEHALRFSSTEARRQDLQRTVDGLGAMAEISRALAGETDWRAILELVAKRGRALVNARALAIELPADGELEVAAAAGELPPSLVGQRMPLLGSVAHAALCAKRPLRFEDQLNRVRHKEYGLGRLGVNAQAGLVVPLVFGDRSFGVLFALDRLDGGPQFTAEDERLLEAVAVSAASSLATAQTAAAEWRSQRLAATEQERGRWARELHDETLQGLAAVELGLAAAARERDRDTVAEAIGVAISQLQGEIAGLRALITELRPPALDHLGARAAIEALAARAARSGLEVDVHIELAYEQTEAARRPAPELETALYRIAQEALTNACKNGRATRAVAEVIEADGMIEVTVRDDGVGFDPAAATTGFGVLGMRERAELQHGSFEIESAPGHGTVVRATLPLRHRADSSLPGPGGHAWRSV